MDTFLRKILSDTITIAELQHLQGEIEGQLASSNGNSCFAARRKIVEGILDYINRNQNQNQVANPVDRPVAGNTECASDENIVDYGMSNETIDHVIQFIRRKLSLSDDAIIPNVIAIESLRNENSTNYHIIPQMFMVHYYSNEGVKITIIQPNYTDRK